MTVQLIKKLSNHHIPRWVVLSIDMILVSCSFLVSFGIIHNLKLESFTYKQLAAPFALTLILRASAIMLTKSYKGIIRYTSIQDASRIFIAMIVSSLAFIAIRQYFLYVQGVFILERSIIVMDFFISLVALISMRVFYKVAFKRITQQNSTNIRNVIIYGAGHTGLMAKRTIESTQNSNLKVVAFLDDDRKLSDKSAEGIPIFFFNKKFDYVLEKYKPKEIIIAVPNIQSQRKKKVIELGLKHDLVIKNVPPIENWINGEFTFKQIKNVSVDDLLGREPINLENKNIKSEISGKVVLVTGAAGSIGSELAKQCKAYNPKYLILLDQAETPLYEIEYQLASKNVEVVIGDVSNEGRMQRVFEAFKPDVVFHAAAYKHVPLMEDNPYEALNTNVFGTRLMANLAVKYGVEKFVLVSTDKAVNPTNIMGASKRTAEIYVQSLNNLLELKDDHHTKFITTRFGNVLGSNGSVIPRFKEQIEKGGPITVTHPDITRYFMTIPEACQLVLEAGAMGRGGEIYIFDMGESVKIIDLAKKMIKLSGFEEGRDIEIVYTGLRPGEKLTEELLNDREMTIGTHHPKIMVAKVQEHNFNEVEELIESLYLQKDRITNKLIVSAMKQLIPEYISNNSIYEELDKKASLKN
ncbi:MAG: polysaccharide biosynthesis protein [Flavobacteriales bacterium]|nr:polysaccharide biosynthesis protein [Flavobacteriales bacterium]